MQIRQLHSYFFKRMLGYFAIAFTLVLLTCFIFSLASNSQAAGTPPTWVGDPSLALTVPDDDPVTPGSQFNMGHIIPSPSPALNTKTLNAQVTTNNPTGYEFSVKMLDTNQCLKHSLKQSLGCSSITAPYKINPVAANTPTDSFPTNNWGIATAPYTNWYPVPASNAANPFIIKSASAATSTSGDTVTARFGVKADLAQNAGKYSANLVFSLLSKPLPVVTIASVSPTTVAPGANLTLQGINLDKLYSLKIAGVACESVLIESPTQANCVVGVTTPVGSNQALGDILSIYNQAGTTNATVNISQPLPIVTGVSPNSGHFRGGESITISGHFFTGATNIKVGERNCSAFTVLNDSTATCVTQGIATSFLDNTTPTFSPEASAANPITNYTHPGQMTNATNAASVNVTTANGTNANNTLFTYRYQSTSYTQHGSYLEVLGTDLKLGSKVVVGGTVCKDSFVTSTATAACPNAPTKTAGSQTITIQAPPTPTYQFQPQSVSTALPTFQCSALTTPAYTTTDWAPYTKVVRDTRDGKSYRVRKLPDGRCWMIDNLALSTKTTISANDTDIASDAGTDFVTKWNSLNSNGAPVQSSTTHNNGTCTSHSTAALANGDGYLTCDGSSPYSDANDGYIAYTDPALATNVHYENCTDHNGINPDSLTGCGYLYNWYTSTAGSGHYGATLSSNVSSSICPKGWQLPKGEAIPAQNEFAILNNAMATGASTPALILSTITFPNWYFNGPFEGTVAGGFNFSFDDTGYSGNYWSSSVHFNINDAYGLALYYRDVYPGDGKGDRYFGMGLRCIL